MDCVKFRYSSLYHATGIRFVKFEKSKFNFKLKLEIHKNKSKHHGPGRGSLRLKFEVESYY